MAKPESLHSIPGNSGASETERSPSTGATQFIEYVLEKSSAERAAPLGKILIVDQDHVNRAVLARNLKREGYGIQLEDDGPRAFGLLENGHFDLVLWDEQLPSLNGLDLLACLHYHPLLQNVPVILLSSTSEKTEIARCIKAGASDYFTKPFDPALLKARISSCLDRKMLRDREQRLLAQIKGYQERISAELAEARSYLHSLLPQPLLEPVHADWRLIPSSELGGDGFGYHWIDDDHFVLYLLDVCGHGVGAALLSVAALNTFRSHTLNGVDFRRPADVLSAANSAFPMEHQNNRYFTLWYGVYQRSTRTLTYSTGGHPPAFLFEPGSGCPKKLATRGMMIGALPGIRYAEQSCEVPPGSRLLLFCDGAYEISLPSGRVYTLDEFAAMLSLLPDTGPLDLDAIVEQIFQVRGSRELEDDLTLIAAQF
jgi:sigma-B regulation protein RsbU (phosphoserine phosphatase)